MLRSKGTCKGARLNNKLNLSLGHSVLLAYQFKRILNLSPIQLRVLLLPVSKPQKEKATHVLRQKAISHFLLQTPEYSQRYHSTTTCRFFVRGLPFFLVFQLKLDCSIIFSEQDFTQLTLARSKADQNIIKLNMGCEQLIVSSEETYPEALGILGDLFVVDKQLIMKRSWEELELYVCTDLKDSLSSQHFFHP